MRLTCFGIVAVLMMFLCAGKTNAQVPERILFQPGSYAYGMYQGTIGPAIATKTMLVAAADASIVFEDDSNQTPWEQTFGSSGHISQGGNVVEVHGQVPSVVPCPTPAPCPAPALCPPPYLAYHRHPITHRIHVVPYQPGYACDPCAYPTHQSKLNRCLSSLPCRVQNRPQIPYLGYYDPMPCIVTDKPSRCQLILGYPNAHWTSCCYNQYGQRLAQCPGLDVIAVGPPAEAAICNQYCDHYVPQGPLGGILAGPRAIGEGPVHQSHHHHCEHCQNQ